MTPVKAVNHIGIAVRSIDAQKDYHQNVLGAVFEGVEHVADQKVNVGFFRIGDVRRNQSNETLHARRPNRKEQHERAFAQRYDEVGGERGCDFAIAHEEELLVGGARKSDAQLPAHGGMRAVATAEITRAHVARSARP